MVEVIHAYHRTYPFGLNKESENTFVQQSKLNLKQMEIAVFRQKAKIYQEMDNLFFMRMIKVLKEDNNLYFVYEYYETSLEKYLGNLKKSVGFSMTREIYRSFLNDFNTNINEIINSLIHSQIKAVLLLQNVACAAKNEKSYNFSLKVFIDTQAEYLSISKHNYESKDPIQKDQKSKNQQFLFQFYEAERKRLAIQFEQLCQRIFGKINETTQRKQTPNFIINGTKLIFINKDQKQQQQNEAKKNKNNKEDLKPKIVQKQQKENTPKNVEVLPSSQKIHKNQLDKSPNLKKSEKIKIQGPIIDFDQSFQPEFKPQQFTKQKTFIYEQTDYLDSLEQQLKRITSQKKQQQTKKTQSFQDHKMLKIQQNKKQTMEQASQARLNKIKHQTKQSQQQLHNQQKSKNNDSVNQTRMIQSTNSNTSNQNNSNNQSTDKKAEKVNKYKMKIITSHEIQIEGGGEQPNVHQIEKEIINNIKNGKINLKDLGNIQKNNSNSKNQSEQSTNKNNLSGNSLNGCNNSKEQQANKTKLNQENERLINTNQKEKIQKEEENNEIQKLKQPLSNKTKSINQIIQKIGISTHLHTENAEKYQKKKQNHMETRPESKIGFQVKTIKNQTLENNKKERLQTFDNLEKNEAIDNEIKTEKAQNYINKIKQAKSKAQQLLREYTKKKQ